MGPESTIPYYHDIVYGVQNRLGRNFSPNLTIESVNVFDVLKLCNEQKYDEVSPVPCLDTLKIHIQHLIDWIVE